MSRKAAGIVREVTGATQVFVHLAHPNDHVRAPAVLNDVFQTREIDAVAVSVDVTPGDMSPLVRGLRGWRNLCGIGVTMPHKVSILDEVDEVVADAAHVGAANLIRRARDGRLIATNIDGSGFIAGLRSSAHDPSGRRVLLVGAGGAGRAIAFSLANAAVASMTIANRTASKAKALAKEVRAVFPDIPVSAGPPDPATYDIVINATSLGLRAADALPIDTARLNSNTLVAEVVARPARTRLMELAERRGCTVHAGLPMLTSQVEQLLTFLDLNPEAGLSTRGHASDRA